MRWVELPLLKRELLELAQRKRTYVLRCLCLAVFTLVFLTMYFEMTSRTSNFVYMLGQGREMVMVLFVTLLVAIFALAPAMSCSAISSEKEKQTLGLLLISRLRPWTIIIEKLASRMLPMLALVVVATPLFGVSYLFGGISFGDILLGLGVLVFAAFQVAAVAIMCSALFESGIAAFWGTYIILLQLYFAWPLLVEADVLPRPELSKNLHDLEFMFFPGFQLMSLMENAATVLDYAILIVPQTLITVLFVFIARFALTRFCHGAAFSLPGILNRAAGVVVPTIRKWIRSMTGRDAADVVKPVSDAISVPTDNALSWRESKTSIVTKPRMMATFCVLLLLMQGCVLKHTHHNDAPDFCALMSFGVLIIALLIVLGLSAKVFAKERERQTLDSLLAAPFTNREILSGKTQGINRLILKLLLPVLITCLFNVINTDLRKTTLTSGADLPYESYSSFYSDESKAVVWKFEWWAASFMYATGVIGNALIYMHLVKWIALYFGLRLNSQMKAMVGTLVTVLSICFVPLLSIVMTSLLAGHQPDEYFFFWFSSPMIVTAFNEFHDFMPIFRSDAFPDSEVLLIFANFVVYGSLLLAARTLVQFQRNTLLGRRDNGMRRP